MSVTPTLNQLACFAFDVWAPTTIDLLACEIITGTSTAEARLGVYADTGDGYPGALLAQTGALDASTNGVKTGAVSVVLPVGRVWLAYVAQVVTTAVRGFSAAGAPPMIGVTALPTAVQYMYVETGVTGALTDPWTPTVTTGGGNMPRVWFRAA